MAQSRQQGFSLVEVLVALLILGFVALGIASLFSHAMVVNASGFDYAVLASEARRALEALQSAPFAGGALADTAGTPRAFTGGGRGFTVRYTVEDFAVSNWVDAGAGSQAWPAPDGLNPANIKRITVRVSSDRTLLQGQREFVVTALKIPG